MMDHIITVRRAIEAFNTGDTRDVQEFISSEYINRESPSDLCHTRTHQIPVASHTLLQEDPAGLNLL